MVVSKHFDVGSHANVLMSLGSSVQEHIGANANERSFSLVAEKFRIVPWESLGIVAAVKRNQVRSGGHVRFQLNGVSEIM